MPTKINPFVQWLGLNPKIKNPHHFQLLGVSTKLTEQAEIEKAVELGVKRNLDLLAKVPAGEHDDLLQKLKQRIAVARKTLVDPDLRRAYVTKLKKQIKAQQSASVAPAKQPSTKSNPNFTSPTLGEHPPTQPGPSQPDVPQTNPTHPSQESAPPINRPDSSPGHAPASVSTPAPVVAPAVPNSDAPIPMAVPLNAGSATETPSVHGVAVNMDGVPINEVKINRKIVAGRKKSKAGLIVGVLMVIVAGAGGALIYLNKDALMELGGVDPDSPAAPGHVEDDKNIIPDEPKTPIGETDKGDGEAEPVKKLPSLDIDKLPEVDITEVMEHPDTQAATLRKPETQRKIDERNKERLKAMGFDEIAEEGSPSVKTPSGDPKSMRPGPLVELDDFQLSKIRRHLERARRSLYRRELGAAQKAIDYANSVIAEVAKEANSRFGPDQAPIAALVSETHEMHELIEGFWKQVVSSCESIAGGQEIIASGQTLGFIEGDSNKFIVRHAGLNVTYEYSFCPRSLAVSLAKQGAIEDIPTWNKQLAAFYALDQLTNDSDHARIIDQLLTESEEAGHDCDGIRHFASFKFDSVGRPAEKVNMPNKKTFNESVEMFRNENNYKDVSKLAPGMATMLSDLLLQIDSPNFDQHVVLLEEARNLAIQSGDASATEDAIIELDIFANIDRANLTCESFDELADGALTGPQRRTLIERAIPFLKSELAKSARPRTRESLAKKLMKIASAYGMTDAVRRLHALEY